MTWFLWVTFKALLVIWGCIFVWVGFISVSNQRIKKKYDQCYVEITKGPSKGNHGRIAQTPFTPFGYFKIVVTYNKKQKYAVFLKKDSFMLQKAEIFSIQQFKKDVI